MALPAGHTKWLGATPDKERGGTNFAFYAGAAATKVELCLFDQAEGTKERVRYELTAKEEVYGDDGHLLGHIWHGFAQGVQAGALYGFRVGGPYRPEEGYYFNPNKLLLDPMAKAVTGQIHEWEERNFVHNFDDNADIMPKARVVDWQALQQKAAPSGALYSLADTIIREIHVKGATKRLKRLPEAIRGKFKALSSSIFIDWAKQQKVTSLELMPIASFGTDLGLFQRGQAHQQKLTNYWGYMPAVFTALHTDYGTSDRPEEEFLETVSELKDSGIEVIMDVVPNHMLEGGLDGPAIPVVNLRGMDNSLYLSEDYTGTGNTRNFGHPINRRMFQEELRYWRSLGVSGFRIDLAPVLGRVENIHTRRAYYYQYSTMMRQLRGDPELQDIKLFGEPWDVSKHHDGYQRERLAVPVSTPHENNVCEWDDVYREHIKDITLNHEHNPLRSVISWVLAGNGGLLNRVGMLCSHDGGRIIDQVSYQEKNNGENLENNGDGHDFDPHCYYGEMEDRLRVQRFGIAMLALSQGPVLMTQGDESCHSNNGNTNAYAQDKEEYYFPWDEDVSPEGQAMSKFTEQVFGFRHQHVALRRGRQFTGTADPHAGLSFNRQHLKDLTKLDQFGNELNNGLDHTGPMMLMLSGDPGNRPDETHFIRRVMRSHRDSPLLILVNGTNEDHTFTLPTIPGVRWHAAINSHQPHKIGGAALLGGKHIKVGWKSLMVFEGQRMQYRQTLTETIYDLRDKAHAR